MTRRFMSINAPFVVMSALVFSVSACTDTDLQGNKVSSVDAAVDKYCQEERGLTYGSEEYKTCVISRQEYIRSSAAKASVL